MQFDHTSEEKLIDHGDGEDGESRWVKYPKTIKIIYLTYYAVPPTMNTEYCKILEWGPRRDHKADGGPPVSEETHGCSCLL